MRIPNYAKIRLLGKAARENILNTKEILERVNQFINPEQWIEAAEIVQEK